MAILNRESGKPKLIRNCTCGSKPKEIHFKNIYGEGYHAYCIKCPECDRNIFQGYAEASKDVCVASVIDSWNKTR